MSLQWALARGLQGLLGVVGVGFVVWAWSDSRFRGSDGFLSGDFIVPQATGLAFLILSWSVAGRWRAFAFWLALALVGQAIFLQLVDAGSALGYQHYNPFEQILTGTQPLLLAFLLLQTFIVAGGIGLQSRKIWRWLSNTFKTWQLVGVGIVFVLPAAAVSPAASRFLLEVVLAVAVQAIQLGTILLMVMSLTQETSKRWGIRFDRIVGSNKEDESPEPGRPGRLVLIAAVWVVAVAVVLNIFVYERHPHVTDEVVYLLQARYFADGTLTQAAPPVPDAFEIYLMQVEPDRWYPTPPPGWPAMLATGTLIGAAWLVNPVLFGINILLAYMLLSELYSRRVASVAVLLLAVSPWFLFLGMSFMTHMFTLTCAMSAALGVAWARRSGMARWALIGGLALGAIALIRPLEALLMAVLLGLWAIGFGGKRLKKSAIAGLVVGSMTVGATVLLYNHALTGDPTLFPLMAYTEEYFGPNSNALGFGPDRGMGWELDPNPGHSPVDALINSNLNTFSLNIELFGWGMGSLLLAAVMILGGRLRQPDYLMLAVIAGVWIVHFFYYFSGGPDFGARYWFLMIIPLAALTSRGIQILENKLGSGPLRSMNSGALVTSAVLVLSVLALVNFIPWRAVDKYHDYRGMRPDVRELAEQHNFGKSLVLIQGERHPDYSSAAIYNPLDLSADAPVYAWDRSKEVRQQTLAAYPDRAVWLVQGPSVTNQQYQVIAGPLQPDERIDVLSLR